MAGALGTAGWAAPLGDAGRLCLLPLLPITTACSDLGIQHCPQNHCIAVLSS